MGLDLGIVMIDVNIFLGQGLSCECGYEDLFKLGLSCVKVRLMLGL